MKATRPCLMINMDASMREMARFISIKYGITNPRNLGEGVTNIAEVVRILFYYLVRKNRIRCVYSSTDIPDAMKAQLDKLTFDFENVENMKTYIDSEDKLQVRVTDVFRKAISDLAEQLSLTRSSIIRTMIHTLYYAIGGTE